MSDRLLPDFFEADEEGFLQSFEESDSDGFTTGLELALYVPDPWNLPSAVSEESDARVAALPQDGYPQWLMARYPALDWDFGADEHSTALISGRYEPGETTDELIRRLTENPDYMRLRNEGTIYYTLRDAWADHVGVDLYPEDAPR